MHNINIYCKEKHSRWVIATMHKSQVGTQGEWRQPSPASKDRQREMFAYEIQRLSRGVEHAIVKDMIKMKLDPDGFMREVAERPKPDKPVSYTYILNGVEFGKEPPFRTSPGNDLYLRYDFGCPKCHGDNKPLQRRESKLTPILDGLAAAGIEEISFRDLAKACTHYDKTSGV